MHFIHLTTFIQAPLERVFDLSRNVTVHKLSMARFNERIIQGSGSGLMELNDEVMWQAKHLFKNRVLKIKVSALVRPEYFKEEQLDGDFKQMKHEHFFKAVENGTLMIDQVYYDIPFKVLGKLANKFYLEKYLTRLLSERNAVIKKIAESNQWKQYLNS